MARDVLKSIANQHWFCIVPLLPAVAMITIHHVLGLSDELMGHLVGTPEPTKAEIVFNYAMVCAFYCGIAEFLAHAFHLARRSYFLLAVKLIGLAGSWYLFLLCAASSSASSP